MHTLSHGVVWVHLYAEVALGVDELDQEGQLTMVLLAYGLTKDGFWMLADNGYEIATSIRTIGNDTGTGRNGTHLPTLANGLG